MTGFATNISDSKRCTGLRRFGLFFLCVLMGMAASHAVDADPLLNDTLEKVTNTAGQAVSGTTDTVNRTTGTLGLPPGGNTIETDQPLSSVNTLGQDITRPVGVLTAPAPSSPASSAEPAPATRSNPEAYPPYDAFQPYTPDILPRGTLARIYFISSPATRHSIFPPRTRSRALPTLSATASAMSKSEGMPTAPAETMRRQATSPCNAHWPCRKLFAGKASKRAASGRAAWATRTSRMQPKTASTFSSTDTERPPSLSSPNSARFAAYTPHSRGLFPFGEHA